jgi:uncharacterized protein (DUF983 family)
MNHTCPRCHTGKLFTASNPYNLKDLGKMPPECTHCGQPFSPEPGFYFGATYVSYAFSVAFFIIGFGINWLFFKAEFYNTFITLAVIFILFTPIVYRLSRTIWIHFFVRYDKQYEKPNREI